MMFRFSRDKRFYSRVQFEEFAQTAAVIAGMTKAARSNSRMEILTTEDAYTHRYPRVKGRKSYTLEEFTEEVWNRSMSAQLTLIDDTDSEPFLICLSLDKQDNPRSMKFYGQAVEQKLVDCICDMFSQPSFFWSVGDGYSWPLDFFGQRLTGMRLR